LGELIHPQQKEREEFDATIEKKYDPDYAYFVTPTCDCYEDNEVPASKIPDIDDVKNEDDVDTYDQYVGAHLRVSIGDEIRTGKVVLRKRDLDGTVRGASQCQLNVRHKNL
jgi:hypothetical protein